MIEYVEGPTFLFDSKKYRMLLDNDNRYFFLRSNENGNYFYITMEEYIKLINIFCHHSSALLFVKDNSKRKNLKKIKLFPKIIIDGVATIISLSLLMNVSAKLRFESMKKEYQNSSYYSSNDSSVEEIQKHVSFIIEDSTQDLLVDTVSESLYSDDIYVYDLSYLDNYLDYDFISKEKLLETLYSNKEINDNFASLIKEFINSVYKKYPNIDMRVFYENLKTLKIVECTKFDLMLHSLSVDSCACYVRNENTIYTLSDYTYEKGTWDYQIIFHEFSHALKNALIKQGNHTLKVQSGGNSLSLVTVDEALNSVFAVSLFDYDERDIAYQLQSNYCKVMLECVENYSLEDYINHSLSYYAQKLDEHNGDNNYAVIILSLIDTQYKDYHSDKIEIKQEEYYPIYDYICDMYYGKYIDQNMSYKEAKIVADDLVERILFDVPNEYGIDIDRFYENLDNYCALVGIEIINSKTLK